MTESALGETGDLAQHRFDVVVRSDPPPRLGVARRTGSGCFPVDFGIALAKISPPVLSPINHILADIVELFKSVLKHVAALPDQP